MGLYTTVSGGTIVKWTWSFKVTKCLSWDIDFLIVMFSLLVCWCLSNYNVDATAAGGIKFVDLCVKWLNHFWQEFYLRSYSFIRGSSSVQGKDINRRKWSVLVVSTCLGFIKTTAVFKCGGSASKWLLVGKSQGMLFAVMRAFYIQGKVIDSNLSFRESLQELISRAACTM